LNLVSFNCFNFKTIHLLPITINQTTYYSLDLSPPSLKLYTKAQYFY